ncbi:MAG: ABC transporter permease [Gemmatimonadota bacterium]
MLRLWKPDIDQDVDAELAFHLEMRARDYEARGLPPDAAQQAAEQRFGDRERIGAELREHDRRLQLGTERREIMGDLLQDMRYAIRGLLRTPGFTLVAVLTLALGIGANSLIFSLVDAALLRPVPGVQQPAMVFEAVSGPLSYPAFRDYQASNAPVTELAAFRNREFAVQIGERTAPEVVAMISGNYFHLLRARASQGRLLSETDDQSGAAPVVVVSDRYWRHALGADPRVIGRTIRISESPFTIIGVTEPAFRGTRLVEVPDIWSPIAMWRYQRASSFAFLNLDTRGWGWLNMIGRLKDGATLAQAQAALSASTVHQQEQNPGDLPSDARMDLRPLISTATGADVHGTVVQFMTVLTAVVAMVLLIACANIANLLLARATLRRKEIAVRLALGATRGRLLRQLVTEAVVLAGLACAVALGLTSAALGALQHVTLGDVDLSRLNVGLSGGVTAYTAAVSLLTAVLFGLAPALQATRDTRAEVLRETGAGGRNRTRLRDGMLVAQVALSLVLLIGAALFARGLQRAMQTELGFRPDHLAVATVNTGLVRYDTTRAAAYVSSATERIAAIPGIRSVAWAATLPLGGSNVLGGMPEGWSRPGGGRAMEDLGVSVVGTDYFKTLGTPIVEGRAFLAEDRTGAPHATIVNEAFVHHYWPGGSAIGKRIFIGDTVTVVGVARNAVVERLDEQAQPFMYLALAQQPTALLNNLRVVAWTQGDPELMLPAIERALRASGPDVPVGGLSTFGDQIADAVLPQRLGAALLGAFSLLALMIAAVGMYGVVTYLVGQRTREIGIRMALGAQPSAVLGMVVGHNMRRVVIGLCVGIALAVAGTRIVAGFLYGVSATDFSAFAAAAAILSVVSLIAALIPARRATLVNPVRALRGE